MIRTFAAVACLSVAPLALAQAPAAAPPAARGGGSAVAGNPWPQDITANGKTYRIFQPAVTGLDGARAYLLTQVSMDGGGAGRTVTGEAKLQCEVMAADVPGEVELNRFTVRAFTVDGKPASDADSTALSQALYLVAMTTTRTNLLQGMQLVNARGASTPGLSDAMPTITVMQSPAVAVATGGAPALAPLGSTGWKRATNTPFILLQSSNGTWYTRVSGEWQSAPAWDGAFAPAAAPPEQVVAAIGKASPAGGAVGSTPPKYRTPDRKPARAVVTAGNAVLVSIDGPPQLEQLGNGVQRVKNTNSTLLTEDGSSYYLLASGRWFETDNLQGGAWSRVAPADVPASFRNIPSTAKFDHVRAAVPGTPEANEAALAAREIRTVTLKRTGTQPRFSVDGRAPAAGDAFQPIDGTPVSWLPGASQPVVKADGAVFCCDSGAWFTAPAVTGPWTLCDRVPTSVYAIPPSCPIYPCTYVWVFGSTPDTVSFGYSAGYLGTYLQDGTPVYGTGHAYAADAGRSYPQTYGFDPAYDAQTGTFTPADDPSDDYAYYGAADVYPAWCAGDGWAGWGWCPGWCTAWGYGWNNWGAWNHWGWWANNWHPYDSRWGNSHAPWHAQNAAEARARNAQRTKPLANRTWAPGRGDVAAAGSAQVRPVGGAERRDSRGPAGGDRQSMDSQFRGAAQDAPAAFRGPGNEYGGYSPVAYRPWTGTGTTYGGDWGYEPLAGPNGFHPPQQFITPGAYWGAGTRQGNNLGANAGPYHSPDGHGGWGSYDRWAGEGVRGTEYGSGRSGGDRR